MSLPAETADRLSRLLGTSIVDARPVSGGYTAAARWRLALGSGGSAFAKMGTTALTAGALREEAAIYSQLRGPFMPDLLGWEDHPQHPLLVLEDLSSGHWPPPWNPSLIDDVLVTLEQLHGSPTRLRPFRETGDPFRKAGWHAIAADPAPLLSLSLVSPAWLHQNLPQLMSAADAVVLEGDQPIHFDVRSDNMCRMPRGVVLVDWNCACLGNGDLDIAFWLPSLHYEGGPPPEAILPTRPDLASFVCGYFASRAGLPAIPDAPRVRLVQRQQLGTALAWAIRALGIPAP